MYRFRNAYECLPFHNFHVLSFMLVHNSITVFAVLFSSGNEEVI